jgi:putative ABC transport system permease protein
VRTAALALYLPYTEFWWYDYEVEGEQYEPDQEPNAQLLGASPGYFETMGVPILRGREFDERDRPPAPGTVVVNEAFARRHWPDGDALGKRIRLEDSEDWRTIIGVAADTRHRSLNLAPTAQIYVPLGSGEFDWGMPAVIRTDSDPNALIPLIREIVNSMDPDIALTGMMTMEDRLAEQVAEPRFRTLLIGTFGFAALALAVIGVYGVMAYAVAQRTREVGIRMALGANRGHILRDVVARGLILATAGLVIGLAGAYAATTLLESYLYELDVHDPATFALATLVLLLAALLAATLPARRAARVDPMIALRAE